MRKPVKLPSKKKTKKMASMSRTPTKNQEGSRAAPMDVVQDSVPSLRSIEMLIRGVDGKLDRMNTTLGERIDDVESKMEERFAEVTEDVGALKQCLENNELQLEYKINGVLKKHVSGQTSGTDLAALEDKITHTVGKRLGADFSRLSKGDRRRVRLPPNAAAATGPAEASREAYKDDRSKEYWTARRSLRIWPVQGDNLYDAVADFLRNKLQIDRCLIPPRDEMRVRVAEVIGRSKGKNEVVVLFKSAALHDSIRSSAYNLAGSDAGLRLSLIHI